MTDIKFTRTERLDLVEALDYTDKTIHWTFENWTAHKSGSYGRDGYYRAEGGHFILYRKHDNAPEEYMGDFDTLKEMKNYIKLWKSYNEK